MMLHHIIIYCEEQQLTLIPSPGCNDGSDEGWCFSKDTFVQTIHGSFMKVDDVWRKAVYLQDEPPKEMLSRSFWKILMPVENLTCAIWDDGLYNSWSAKKLWDIQQRGFTVIGDFDDESGTDFPHSKVRSTLMSLEYSKEVYDLLELTFDCQVIPDIITYELLNHPKIDEPMSIFSPHRSVEEVKKLVDISLKRKRTTDDDTCTEQKRQKTAKNEAESRCTIS